MYYPVVSRKEAHELDAILNLFPNNRESIGNIGAFVLAKITKIEPKIEMGYTKHFARLEEDELIKVIYSSPMINFFEITDARLTRKGVEFKQTGGYIKRYDEEQTELRYKKYVNIALIVGGIFGAIYYLMEIIKEIINFFSSC